MITLFISKEGNIFASHPIQTISQSVHSLHVFMVLQSWTRLVETKAINARTSQFPRMETLTILQKGFPSPLPSFNVVWKN